MKTQDNLMAAFAGESQANRKYLAYAEQAEKEGHAGIARLFRATAEAETIHALAEFKITGKVNSTAENLQDGIDGETYEFSTMYPEFLEAAKQEGHTAAANAFHMALEAEKVHAVLYKDALANIDTAHDVDYYLCPVCGYIHKGSAPEVCPICHAKASVFKKY